MAKDSGPAPKPNGAKPTEIDPEQLIEWRQNTGNNLFPEFNQEMEQSTSLAGLNYGITIDALMEAIFQYPMANEQTVLKAARANFGKTAA